MVTTVGHYQAIKNNGRWSNRAESLFKVRLIPELSEYYYPQSLIIIDIVVLVNVIIIVAQVINRRRWLRKSQPLSVCLHCQRPTLVQRTAAIQPSITHCTSLYTANYTVHCVHIILHVLQPASISTLPAGTFSIICCSAGQCWWQ